MHHCLLLFNTNVIWKTKKIYIKGVSQWKIAALFWHLKGNRNKAWNHKPLTHKLTGNSLLTSSETQGSHTPTFTLELNVYVIGIQGWQTYLLSSPNEVTTMLDRTEWLQNEVTRLCDLSPQKHKKIRRKLLQDLIFQLQNISPIPLFEISWFEGYQARIFSHTGWKSIQWSK